jgi:hypothetical protein
VRKATDIRIGNHRLTACDEGCSGWHVSHYNEGEEVEMSERFATVQKALHAIYEDRIRFSGARTLRKLLAEMERLRSGR